MSPTPAERAADKTPSQVTFFDPVERARLENGLREKREAIRRKTSQLRGRQASRRGAKSRVGDSVANELRDHVTASKAWEQAMANQLKQMERAEEEGKELQRGVDEACELARAHNKKVEYSVRLRKQFTDEVITDPITKQTTRGFTLQPVVVAKDGRAGSSTMWLWPQSTFTTRLRHMRDFHHRAAHNPGHRVNIHQDPFLDVKSRVPVGTGVLWLLSLQHLVDVEESVPVVVGEGDAKKEVGKVHMKVTLEKLPSPAPLSLADLKGCALHLRVHVIKFTALDARVYSDVSIRFDAYGALPVETPPATTHGTRPVFNFSHAVYVPSVDHAFLQYVASHGVRVEVFGTTTGVTPHTKGNNITDNPHYQQLMTRLQSSEAHVTHLQAAAVQHARHDDERDKRVRVAQQHADRLKRERDEERARVETLQSLLAAANAKLREQEANHEAKLALLRTNNDRLLADNRALQRQLKFARVHANATPNLASPRTVPLSARVLPTNGLSARGVPTPRSEGVADGRVAVWGSPRRRDVSGLGGLAQGKRPQRQSPATPRAGKKKGPDGSSSSSSESSGESSSEEEEEEEENGAQQDKSENSKAQKKKPRPALPPLSLSALRAVPLGASPRAAGGKDGVRASRPLSARSLGTPASAGLGLGVGMGVASPRDGVGGGVVSMPRVCAVGDAGPRRRVRTRAS